MMVEENGQSCHLSQLLCANDTAVVADSGKLRMPMYSLVRCVRVIWCKLKWETLHL